MKYLRGFMLLSILIIILAGCSTRESEQVKPEAKEIEVQEQQPINVEISVNEEFNKDNHLAISGTTNLPTDMELMLTVTSEEGYNAQSKAYVMNGLFQSEWFTSSGQGLPNGKYSVEITSPTANVQPKIVKDVIGEQGVNLSGPLVNEDEIWGKRIVYSYAFSGGEPIVQSTPEDEEIWSTINEYLETGQYMEVANVIDQLSEPSNDLQMMYYYSMYHVYGQDGEDEKSLESLYRIPSDYNGHNADLVSYYKYSHESYEAGRTEPLMSFDDYIGIYKNNSSSSENYRSDQNQTTSIEPSEPKSNDYTSNEAPLYNDSGDYSIYGEYKPVETMTQEEIREELEAILRNTLSGN